MPERLNLLSEIVKSRLNRASGMGLNGLAASSIGFVMLGCIAAGYFGGSWLDRKMGTTWATPAGTFVGMLAGFVEMFRTLKQVAARTKWPSSEGGHIVSNGQQGVKGVKTQHAVRQRMDEKQETDESIEVAPVARQRLFHVPPPPLPEYEVQKVDEASAEEISARLLEGSDRPQ